MKQKIKYHDKFTLSYVEYGDKNGYPILIQHGLIASIDDHDLFDRLIQLKTRVICIARPGYDGSSPYAMTSFAEWSEIVSVLIEGLGFGQFDILGMSSGAPYSYSIGYRFPDQVRNIFILSGMPALYDKIVLSSWPYEMADNATTADLEKLARTLFFSNLSKEELETNAVRDSMMNDCFGVAQDLKLRSAPWGFSLSEVRARVIMRHSRTDDAVPFSTAVRTSELLPNCRLELMESGPHFSNEALDDFIKNQMTKYFETGRVQNGA